MSAWNISRIVALVVFSGLVFSLHVYLYRRLIRDVTEHKKLRWIALGLLIAVGLALPIARASLRSTTEVVNRALVIPLFLWVGFGLYLFLALLATDAWRGGRTLVRRARRLPDAPVSPERRRFLARTVAAGSGVLAGAGVSYGSWRAFTAPEVTEQPIRLRGLPRTLDGLTLVQLTDIHVGPIIQRRFVEMLVEHTNALRPDLVVITGDLVDGSVSKLLPMVSAITGFRSRFGTYFVTGNHDYYSGAEEWVSALQQLGVVCLRNARKAIGDGGGTFDLIGVDDWSARHGGDGYDLTAALAGFDPSRGSVLLAHQPSNFDEVATKGIGLQLSGHTHGGQLFPATWVARGIWGDRNAGLSRTGESLLYTSRGCGFVGPPVRVGSPPELVKVVLTA